MATLVAAVRRAERVEERLTSLFSLSGPDSFPYADDVKWLIIQHLTALVSHFPSIRLKIASFTNDDGSISSNIIQAEGYIPVVNWESGIDNVAIGIRLYKDYPRTEPYLGLLSNKCMTAKLIQFSDGNLPLWTFPKSNLVDLVHAISNIFTRKSPLIHESDQKIARLVPIPPHDPEVKCHRVVIKSISAVTDGLTKKRTLEGEMMEDVPVPLLEDQKVKGTLYLEKEAVKKERLLEEEEKKEKDINGIHPRWIPTSKDSPEDIAQVSSGMILQLPEKEKEKERVWLDEAVIKDEAATADSTIEDLLCKLDKQLNDELINLHSYLKRVRILSREQFFHRTTIARIRTQIASTMTSTHQNLL